MNRKNFHFVRIVAIVLVLSMTAAWLPVGALAAAWKKDKTVVVSMGDSMTNGYGNEGYEGNSGAVDYANVAFSNQFAAWLAGYTGEITNDQVIFEGNKGLVDHRQLAMSGLRATDLYWLLTFDYTDSDLAQQVPETEWDEEKWFGNFDSGDYQTYSDLLWKDGPRRIYNTAQKILSTYGQENGTGYGYYTPTYTDSVFQTVAEFYQKSVKDADVILLSLGNSDFGSFMLWGIANYMMLGTKFTDIYDPSNVYNTMPAHIKNLVKVALEKVNISDMLGGIAGDDPATSAEITAIVEYSVISYVSSYMRVLDAILELNPDVQIIQLDSVNMYAAEDGNNAGTIGEVTDMLFGIVNTVAEVIPKVLVLADMNTGWRANFQYVKLGYVQSLANVFGDDFYKDSDGNYVKYPGALTGNEGYTGNEASVVRQRLFEGIFEGQAFDILQGAELITEEARNSVTLADIYAYELKTPGEKAAYAAENADKAMAIALYLAMEKAHIDGGKSKVMMTALGALGNLNMDLFSGAMDVFNTQGPEKGKVYLEAVAEVISNGTKDEESGEVLLTAQEVLALINGEGSDQVICQIVADKAGDSLSAEKLLEIYTAEDKVAATWAEATALVKDGMKDNEDIQNILSNYGHSSVDEVLSCTNAGHIDDCGKAQSDFQQNVQDVQADLQSAVDGADAIRENYATLKESADSLCLLLATPEVLSDAMVQDDTLRSVLALNCRCMIGTGVGSHPSIEGHNTMFAELMKVYTPAEDIWWPFSLLIQAGEWIVRGIVRLITLPLADEQNVRNIVDYVFTLI